MLQYTFFFLSINHPALVSTMFVCFTSAVCSILTVRFFSSSSSRSLIIEPVTSAAVAEACSTTARSSSDNTTYIYISKKLSKHCLHKIKHQTHQHISDVFTSLCDPEVTERGLSCSDFSISSRKFIMLCSLASESKAPPSGRAGV